MKTYKLSNHIILSGITVSMLFSPLMALPSGGKFTHGTSGSISTSGNNMNITGNGINSVIQWGGGFNIGKGEQVNFNGSNKNYLNIAHGTSKSTIEGILNASGNNVFLINPNGVIITKTGTINANRFVASTSSMSDRDMTAFANLKNFNEGLSFSPVFKTHKAGNVVNMGNINTNDVLLIGNKVDIQGGKVGNENSTTHLVGNEVFVDADSVKLSSTINVTALKGGYIQRQMINFANDNYSFTKNVNINNADYTETNGQTHKGSSSFKKALTIGNMGDEKANTIEWWHFSKGWNKGLGDTKNIDEFRLVDDIYFSGNQGNGVEGKDWQNYANYCIDSLGCTSMIVGSTDTNAFTKTFNGQGYALKNINMDITTLEDKSEYTYIGIFGNSNGANFKNINIDYMNGKIQKQKNVNNGWRYIGGFIGKSNNSFFEYISLSNIESISNSNRDDISVIGGFIGSASGTFSNISLNNIRNIENSADDTWTGGFAGSALGTFSNISLNNIENISSYSDYGMYGGWSRAGGFAGTTNGTFSNISLNNIKNISSRGGNYGNKYGNSYAGGFVGESYNSDFDNISLNSIEKITAYGAWGGYAGGFAGGVGYPYRASFSNIFIYFNPNITLNARKDSSGKLFGKLFLSHNAFLDNIHIYHSDKDLHSATADQNYWGSTSNEIQIHTYDDSTQNDAYKNFSSKADTIQKPILPSKPIDPDNPDSDVILSSDDLYQDTITNEIIADIISKKYNIPIY
ncbi:filamentous hemagglutinin N-terminal domain-containing protein, partial [Campylobacter lari]